MINRNLEKRNDLDVIEAIYKELECCDFIHKLIAEYKEPLKKDKICVEYLDLFGQCVVCINIEDHFAIRDNIGNWHHASATDAVNMRNSRFKGMQILSS